ncbi:MAG: SMP-30/gluconolactonase/LRE family protein [Pseudohongiellaceae bacterium]
MKPRLLSILLAASLAACTGAQGPLPDVRIMDSQVFPESLSAGSDGTLYIGSVAGNVYKAEPGAAEAHAWIRHSPENGILAILGVLVDEASNTLWLCSAPNFFGPERSQGVSAVLAFDLASGASKGNYPFPDGGTCNDLTIARDGTVLATDTPGGRILALDPGAGALRVFGQSDLLRGIDGIAFSGDWILYANNVQTQKIYRVDVNADNTMGALTELQLSHQLGGPDGMRLIAGNRFIQAEGTIGRLSVVTIEGDAATLEVIDDTLESTPGATIVGNTAYVLESNIQYLLNPDMRGQEPPAFMVLARPLP